MWVDADSSKITVAPATRADAGAYACKAANVFLDSTAQTSPPSEDLTVDVHYNDAPTLSVNKNPLKSGEALVLTCTHDANPANAVGKCFLIHEFCLDTCFK